MEFLSFFQVVEDENRCILLNVNILNYADIHQVHHIYSLAYFLVLERSVTSQFIHL